MRIASDFEESKYEAIELKKPIEQAITALLSGYENLTGLKIDQIMITTAAPINSYSKAPIISVEIMLHPLEIK